MPLGKKDALIIVDVQNDFIAGGSLAVPKANQVIAPLNKAGKTFQNHHLPVFLTRDFHPSDHCSFQEYGGPWPPHCVQGTQGAKFASDLEISDSIIISKGMKKEPDEYSGFRGQDKNGNNLDICLKQRGINKIFIGGLATDYCVLYTVLDALKSGYEVFVFTDAIRAVNVKPDDGKMALEQMMKKGATLTTTKLLGE
jgi:nicotinamidase/pyrazinamidase